jgi:DNA-binding FrmR family transcriptional regulator
MAGPPPAAPDAEATDVADPASDVAAAPDAPAGRPVRGYSATKDQLRSRLRRIEGQVRGIDRMVDEERYCIDVLTQISAVQAALDKVALGLLDDHARTCVAGAEGEQRLERTDELMAAVGRMLRRG